MLALNGREFLKTNFLLFIFFVWILKKIYLFMAVWVFAAVHGLSLAAASPGCSLGVVPLRSQGYCAVARGLSGLHWVRCNGRGPHLKWRQETHVSSPDFPWARSDSDRSFAAEFEQESQASSCVEEWNSACLSSCSRGDRSLLELCVEPAAFTE